jgi:DNA-binding response OmpR family regulator
MTSDSAQARASDPVPPAEVALQSPTPAHSTQRASVLVIEDEPGLAEVIAINLQASGYEATVAHDGLQALYLLDRSTPDVILLDLQLPQVSGFRLIQLLRGREATATVPVIVMTALSFREAEEVIRAGADAFLTKPFAPEDVVARVAQLLAQRSGGRSE